MTLPPSDPPIFAGVLRWKFTNPDDILDTWTFDINPNTMSSFQLEWDVQKSVRSEVTGLALIRRLPKLRTASFGGVVRTKEMHDQLVAWTHRDQVLHLSDHLNRTWEVLLDSIDITPGKTRKQVPWRMTYTVSLFILREVV